MTDKNDILNNEPTTTDTPTYFKKCTDNGHYMVMATWHSTALFLQSVNVVLETKSLSTPAPVFRYEEHTAYVLHSEHFCRFNTMVTGVSVQCRWSNWSGDGIAGVGLVGVRGGFRREGRGGVEGSEDVAGEEGGVDEAGMRGSGGRVWWCDGEVGQGKASEAEFANLREKN